MEYPNEEMRFENFETVLKSIHDSVPGDASDKRIGVAAAFGYLDAKTVIFYKETYGLSIADQIIIIQKNGANLRMDWSGLRHELLMLGKKESAVEAEIAEAKEFEMQT
jgi:hypothetical protein